MYKKIHQEKDSEDNYCICYIHQIKLSLHANKTLYFENPVSGESAD